MTLWRDGFTIDDGPLMRLDDPANKEHLAAIGNGEAPMPLMKIKPGQEVDVKLINKTEEDYQPPAKKPTPSFTGTGNRLGSISSAPPVQHAPVSSSNSGHSMSIDASLPTTQIQLRLADGTRLVSRFNHTHTITDLYNFVRLYPILTRSRPNSQPFVLQTSMPTQNIDECKMTLAEAKLLNAVVFQKYI